MQIMRIKTYFLAFLLLFSFAVSINSEVFCRSDSVKVDSLNELSFKYQSNIPDSGISVGLRSSELAIKLNYKKGNAVALKNIGVNYWSKGYYDLAMDYFFQSLKIFEEINDKDGILRIYNNIGLIYITNDSFEKGIEIYNKTLQMSKEQNNFAMLSSSLLNLGIIYHTKNEYEKSNLKLLESLEKFKEIKDSSMIAQVLCYLGFNYTQLGEYNTAINYLSNSLSIYKNLNDKRWEAMVLNIMANYYLKTNNYKRAIEYALEGYQLSRSLGLLYDQYESVKYISDAYKKMNNYKKAYEYQTIQMELADSLKNEENIKKKKELEMEYEFSKKTQAMELLQQKKDLQYENKIYKGRLLIFFISGILILAIVFGVILFRNYKQKDKMNNLLKEKNEKITEQKEHLEQLNIELNDLNQTKDKFFSIIAHDLKNPISAFYGLTDVLYLKYEEFDDDDRYDIIKEMKTSSAGLYNLLDNLLTWSRSKRGIIDYNPDHLNLKLLVSFIFETAKTQADKKKIELLCDISEKIDVYADHNMLNTVIRNLVSNAIKFTNKGGVIHINAIERAKNIEIHISDNGVGMDEETMEKLFRIDQTISHTGTNNETGTGLGLILCKEFIDKHSGSIDVESRLNEGTTFKVILPKVTAQI